MTLLDRAREARKVLVYVLGVLGQLVALGVVPDAALPWVAAALAAATGLGIYSVPNAPPGKHASQ